jgi:hypothetical protein
LRFMIFDLRFGIEAAVAAGRPRHGATANRKS